MVDKACIISMICAKECVNFLHTAHTCVMATSNDPGCFWPFSFFHFHFLQSKVLKAVCLFLKKTMCTLDGGAYFFEM